MPRLIEEHNAKLREQLGGRWRITIITPGRGSSGLYTEEILARDAASAFPKGTKLWFMHPKEGEGAGDRDPRDQWGVLDEDASWDAEAGEVVSIARVKPHWREVVDSLGEDADLSIYAWAEFDEDDTITALLPNRTNSVDIVSYPGRPGSGLDRKIEAAREAAPKPAVEASAEEKENTMDEKAIEALVQRLLEAALAPVITFVNESKTAKTAEAQAQVDAEAVESALAGYEEKVAAIEAADLLEPQVKELKARARKGEDITEAIKTAESDAKTLVEAVKARLEENIDDDDQLVGRIREGAVKSAAEALPKGW